MPRHRARHQASSQDVACVVSGKAAQAIKATGSWKLPIVWQGPKDSKTQHRYISNGKPP